MKYRFVALLAVVAVVLVALAPAAGAGGQDNSFTASLKGRSEEPPVDTNAAGQALFKLHKGELRYKLIVANIDNVTASHIHCGIEGQNGPVTVTLFGGLTSDNGVIAQGIIEDADVTEVGCGSDVAGLIAAMAAGDTYVNVHTIGHLSGELRGQIK